MASTSCEVRATVTACDERVGGFAFATWPHHVGSRTNTKRIAAGGRAAHCHDRRHGGTPDQAGDAPQPAARAHASSAGIMAGRAGRRGIDTVGHVIHCNNLFRMPEFILSFA